MYDIPPFNAHAISLWQDYSQDSLSVHLMCVLKGASTFFHDLSSAIRKFHSYRKQVKLGKEFLFAVTLYLYSNIFRSR